MRTLGPLALVALFVLSGCDHVFPAHPSGKSQILHFDGPTTTLVAGLRGTITVASAWYEGCGSLDWNCVEHPYDFSNATFEVTAPGLTVLSQQVTDAGLDIEIACTAPAEVPAELHVRVMADGAPRYEDGIDVVCRAVRRAIPSSALGPWKKVPLGATVTLQLVLIDANEEYLRGRGLQFPDPAAPLVPHVDYGDLDFQYADLYLDAVAVGAGVAYTAGAWRDTLPYEVLSDDAWDLVLATSAASATMLHVDTKAVTPSGEELELLAGCHVQVTAAGQTFDSYMCAPYIDVPAATGEVCVTAYRHSKCALFSL